ncbi:hypothetical protein [uncultured Tepidimonas sp.]|uniref:hypothetical protein n=1 Tax=uncultured Tepidimonas sp. TaxID=453579 RepID=UPI00261B4CEB|nr:hypothetical protein [uncultured Tepidimonas sp.]
MTTRRVAASVLPTHWTPEQALAVFECLQTLSEQLWGLYGPQIQQAWRDQLACDTPTSSADSSEPF